MTTAVLPELFSQGHHLDDSEASFGFLESSVGHLDDPVELRRRLAQDGYLYVPGFFDREEILAARASMTNRLTAEGLLNPAHPAIDAVANPARRTAFKPELALNNPAVARIVFGERLLRFYERFFGEDILHFDYTWVRAVGPGVGTPPHCDLVYMGRGTHDLITCWIPYGDVPLELGGLIVLEGSHRQGDRLKAYLGTDVDAYCENRPEQARKVKEGAGEVRPGWLSRNPVTLREKLGGRWLTAWYRAGDLVTFKMNLVHGSLDNQTNCVRLSTDTRYQRASEPADERWIGTNPAGHSFADKRGRIC